MIVNHNGSDVDVESLKTGYYQYLLRRHVFPSVPRMDKRELIVKLRSLNLTEIPFVLDANMKFAPMLYDEIMGRSK